MAYLAFRNEVDLSALFDRLPDVRWVVPRVAGKRMTVHEYEAGRLVRHRFGMLEPDAGMPRVSPKEIDVVLVPGVAFDRNGCRLGLGGGYYDRFLPTTPAVRVGIAHSACLADELPCGGLDQRVGWIVTPEETIRCDGLHDADGG
jgi:5-formyltetrahydrofolate cyclo-ligase